MLGLQLYTVRSIITDEQTAYETLKKIQKIGYECVQLAGTLETVTLTAHAAMKAGMPVLGFLVDIDLCEQKGETLFELARMCGASDIGISSTIKTEEEANALIARVNRFAKKAKENGFTFSYHNHSNEFIRGESGKTLMQLLIEGFDPAYANFMPDTYWLQHGGNDVRDFLQKLAGRAQILHLKDMKRTKDGQTYAEIGKGNLNFSGILTVAKEIGIRDWIVEQDLCDGDPLDSIKISLDYVKSIS